MCKFILLFAICQLNATYAYAQQVGSIPHSFSRDACLWIETEDGTVKNPACFKIKVSDGSLTNNGDGSFSLSTSGSSYTNCWESNGSGGIMPVSGVCGDALWEDNGSGGIMPKT